jgi:hypothetical protein
MIGADRAALALTLRELRVDEPDYARNLRSLVRRSREIELSL